MAAMSHGNLIQSAQLCVCVCVCQMLDVMWSLEGMTQKKIFLKIHVSSCLLDS